MLCTAKLIRSNTTVYIAMAIHFAYTRWRLCSICPPIFLIYPFLISNITNIIAKISAIIVKIPDFKCNKNISKTSTDSASISLVSSEIPKNIVALLSFADSISRFAWSFFFALLACRPSLFCCPETFPSDALCSCLAAFISSQLNSVVIKTKPIIIILITQKDLIRNILYNSMRILFHILLLLSPTTYFSAVIFKK